MSRFKDCKPKAWMDLIAWVKICKERLPTETNLTPFLLSVAYGCSFFSYVHCNSYLISQDPGDPTGNFIKGLLSRRGILLMTELSFKCWAAASRNTKPISLKQLRGWLCRRDKIMCVRAHVCVYTCECLKAYWPSSRDILPCESK